MRRFAVAVFIAFFAYKGLYADARPNPRGGGANTKAAAAAITARGEKEVEVREQVMENNRTNRTTQNKGVVITGSRAGVRVGLASHGASTARSGTIHVQPLSSMSRSAMMPRTGATPMLRSGAAVKSSIAARSALSMALRPKSARNAGQASRARGAMTPNKGRATALFTNTAAMGTEYNQCRESYFTCMDQFCGLKSDAYRRCLCSNKFYDFKERDNAIEEAKILITQFNDNNLFAIGLSGDEVNAMYSASEGEAAMKKDTSASAQMLANINDLLSGKKKSTSSSSSAVKRNTSLGNGSGGLNLDFSSGDIWGGGDDIFSSGGSSSIFGGGSSNAIDLENLEGSELYNAVHKQCMEASSTCSANQSSGNMVTSAYTVLIAQDCSMYEKSLDTKKVALESMIRDANNAMMDARLEDFRAKNSATMNECIDNIRSAMQEQYICGANWDRCLDFTGQFINPTTGEILYTQRLFDLGNQMDLTAADAFSPSGPNAPFINSLNAKRSQVTQAFSTCRDNADDAWSAFMQQALIEISQAQAAKIEEVKGTCVDTMKECYDKQTGAMKRFSSDVDEALSAVTQSASAALGQRTAAAMCEEKVFACAALFSPPGACVLTDGAISNATSCQDARGQTTSDCQCGLQSLLDMVDLVDDVKVSTMCKSELKRYMEETCGPISESSPFPYGCRHRPLTGSGSIFEMLVQRAMVVCKDPNSTTLDADAQKSIRDIMNEMNLGMQPIMRDACESGGLGVWVNQIPASGKIDIVPSWVSAVYTSVENFANVVPGGVVVQLGRGSEQSPASTTTGTVAYSDVSESSIINGFPGSQESMAVPTAWGYCQFMDLAMKCEAANQLVGYPVATFDNMSRICNLTPSYYEVVCVGVLGGLWDGTNCSFVPPASNAS